MTEKLVMYTSSIKFIFLRICISLMNWRSIYVLYDDGTQASECDSTILNHASPTSTSILLNRNTAWALKFYIQVN